jgi:hypothetical protein
MAEADVDMPGAPRGPSNPMWPTKEQPWRDESNPWPYDPSMPNEGGRIGVPTQKDPDGMGPGSTGVTNTDVPI